MNRLCTVCARGGSKGLPGKNLRLVAGLPLIQHTLMQARESGIFTVIAVSSDSPAILEAASGLADELIERPAELASDTAGKLPAVRHAAETVESRRRERFSTLVDLDVTSPLRLPVDIVAVVDLLETRGVANVITGALARRSPYFNMVEVDGTGVARLAKAPPGQVVRRQDAPTCFDMNASIYAWRRDAFFAEPAIFYEDTLLFEMPEERSVDIDSDLDLQVVRMLLEERVAPGAAAPMAQ